MRPRTIDEVIERLRSSVRESIGSGDRLGYFAALYLRVTEEVRDGIRRGEFEDGPRMERLDVLFANRYLDALERYRAGELPTGCWMKAFEAARHPGPIVLQHLLAGMNAHINLDLGVAAARIAPGAALAALRGDFDRINAVLARLTPVVEQEIDGISPKFAALTRIAPRLELRFVGFSMEKAREAAWAFARELAPLRLPEQLSRMARRDAEVCLLGTVVLTEGLVVRAIRLREGNDVAGNIRALATGELKVSVPPTVALPGPGAAAPA